MFCQSKKKKKDEEKGVYCPIAQKTIQPPKTGSNFESLVFFPSALVIFEALYFSAFSAFSA